MLEVPVRQDETVVPRIARNGDSRTVAVYAPQAEKSSTPTLPQSCS
jgi:hypothetical protein